MTNKIKTSFNVIEEKSSRLAVLIDADNASPKDIEVILAKVATIGDAIVKRIYGNFASGNQWKQTINDFAIKPMQQFAFTTGKNATDGFMMIDAMDLLYTERYDGFCIVSSDSDFTALAIRLKEQGVQVYGFGKKQTPTAFINACSQFIYVENLLPNEREEPAKNNNLSSTSNPTTQEKKNTELPIQVIESIFKNNDGDEWVNISAFGSTLKRLIVDFDPRNYGCESSKITSFIKKHSDIFEYKMINTNSGEHMFVKLKTTNQKRV